MARELNSVEAQMLSDAEVLAALSEVLSPGELSQAMERILRVPEAWNQLHDPSLLEQVTRQNAASSTVPSHMAFMVIGIPDLAEHDRPLPEAHEARLDQLWKDAVEGLVDDLDFESVALLTIGLLREYSKENGPQSIARLALEEPNVWRSSLSCAWPHLTQPEQLLSNLIRNGRSSGVSLAAHILLANISPIEAAETLFISSPHTSNQILLALQEIGEYTLAKSFAETTASMSVDPNVELTSNSAMNLLASTTRNLLSGDLEKAHQNLNKAWETASHTIGLVADKVAEIALLEGDPVVEVEARQQALRSHSSSVRRAWLGFALLQLGHPQEALASLQHDPETLEELIAVGLILSKLGETTQATQSFNQAVLQLPKAEGCDDRLLKYLLDGLKSIGEIEQALLVARFRVHCKPTSIESRIDLSEMLNLAGDSQAAAKQAHLALVLDPSSTPARFALAHSLQADGRPEAALPHWQTLVTTEPESLANLANCALDAGQMDLARETAQCLLQEDQNSFQGQIVLGKALVALGEHESARGYLDKAIQIAPQYPEPWIALAEFQMTSGDDQAAGATLSAGTQAAPNHGSLYIALSRWLRNQGRLSDALKAAKKATNLNQNQAQWLVEYGDLLRNLGHHDRALLALRKALSRQPANWEARLALALTYEQRGEVASAARLLKALPPETSPETHFLVGRILAKSGKQGEHSPLNDVVTHLEHARSGGCQDPSIDYWLGLAHEHAGQADEAFHAYQHYLQNDPEENLDLRREAVLGFARSALATDLVSLSLSTLEEERKRYPTSTEILVLLSEAYLKADLPAQALRTVRQAADLDPTSEEILRMLSRAATETGEITEAIEAVKRLVDIRQDDAIAWLELAELSQKAGKSIASRNALAQSLRLERRQPNVLRRTAEVLLDMNNGSAAQRMLRQASILQPEDPATYQKLAILSEQLGDLETAQQAWRHCSELEPENHNPLDHAAQALWGLNRRSAAIGLWQHAAALCPEDGVIQTKLAKAYLANGETERGLNHYSSALELITDDADLTLEAGIAVLRHGSPLEALELLQRAARLAPNKTDPLIVLGECLLNLDQPSEAREVLKQAIQCDNPPQQAYALLALAELGMDDFSSAKATLNSAKAITPQSREDAVWLSRGALRMGFWQQAVKSLEEWLAFEDDISTALELTQLRLRLLDAHWIYAVAANAHKHAPGPGFTTDQARQTIRSLIETCRQKDAPKTALDSLTLWSSISKGDFDDEALQALKTTNPKDASSEITQSLAIAFLRESHPEDAEKTLRSYDEALNPDAWGAILLGLAHAAKGQHTQARHAFQIATRNPAIRPLTSYLIARSWWAEDQAKKAADSFNAAIAAWPNEPAWHFQLASLYLEEGELDSALPHLHQSVELEPEESVHLLAYARALRDTGQLSEAEKIYSRILEAKPAIGQIWKEAGQIALAAGHATQADTWFERACTLLPSDVHCLIGSARSAMALGQDRQALERSQAALRLAPDDYQVLLGMGEIFAAQNKFEKALHAYDQALERTSNPLNVQLARCKLLVKIGNANQASAVLHNVLEANPDDQRAWAALAEACEAANQLESALDAAAQAVRLSPRNPSYRLHLGRLCRKSGQLDRALDELAHAQSSGLYDANFALELGHIYEARRESKQALEAYKQAIAIDPNCDQAHFLAGLILKRQKEYQQAANMIERAVELNPRDPDVLHQLAAVRALELIHGGTLKSAVSL